MKSLTTMKRFEIGKSYQCIFGSLKCLNRACGHLYVSINKEVHCFPLYSTNDSEYIDIKGQKCFASNEDLTQDYLTEDEYTKFIAEHKILGEAIEKLEYGKVQGITKGELIERVLTDLRLEILDLENLINKIQREFSLETYDE